MAAGFVVCLQSISRPAGSIRALTPLKLFVDPQRILRPFPRPHRQYGQQAGWHGRRCGSDRVEGREGGPRGAWGAGDRRKNDSYQRIGQSVLARDASRGCQVEFHVPRAFVVPDTLQCRYDGKPHPPSPTQLMARPAEESDDFHPELLSDVRAYSLLFGHIVHKGVQGELRLLCHCGRCHTPVVVPSPPSPSCLLQRAGSWAS